MIRVVALLACLAGPAMAQSYGVPPALSPCTDRHLDPLRYRADLEAEGWVFIPAGNRAAQLVLLNETFVTLVAVRDGPREERLARGRILWAELGETQLVFATANGAEALMVSGGTNAAGESQLRCWMAFADGTRMDTLYDQLLAEAEGEPEMGEEQVIILTPQPEAPDETINLYLTRPAPDIETPATRAGIATILTLAPGGAE